MIRELIAIAAWVIVLVSQYCCKVVLELISLAVLTSRSVLLLKPYFHSSTGAFSQTSALPLEALVVLTGVVLLGREGLSNFRLFSFTSQSHRGHGEGV